MVGLDPIVLTTIFALPVSLTSFAVFHASRSARRNHARTDVELVTALCTPRVHWRVRRSSRSPDLRASCAAKERRRLRRGLIAAVTISTVTVLGSLPSPCGRRPSLVPTLDPRGCRKPRIPRALSLAPSPG